MATDKKNKKQATLAYVAKAKYKKKPWLLAEFGFQAYREEGKEGKEGADVSEGTPTFYAQPIEIPVGCRIHEGMKNLFAKYAKTAKNDKDMEEIEGVSLDENGNAVFSKEILDDISQGQLAICDQGSGAWYLFINLGGLEFVGAEDILDAFPSVTKLIEAKVVYKTKYKEN